MWYLFFLDWVWLWTVQENAVIFRVTRGSESASKWAKVNYSRRQRHWGMSKEKRSSCCKWYFKPELSVICLPCNLEHRTQNTEVEAREIDVLCLLAALEVFHQQFPQSTMGVEFKIVLSEMYVWLINNHSC